MCCCNIFEIRGLNFLGWDLVLGLKYIWEQESLKSVLRSLDCSDHKLTEDELPILAHLLSEMGLAESNHVFFYVQKQSSLTKGPMQHFIFCKLTISKLRHVAQVESRQTSLL